jgi:hypothetical protein
VSTERLLFALTHEIEDVDGGISETNFEALIAA